MKKSLLDTPTYQDESDKDDQALGRIGGFLSNEQVSTAKARDSIKANPGSFGAFASNIANEVIGAFNGEGHTLAQLAKNQPVGKLFLYQGSFLVKTPFNTIVGAQTYVDVLQSRVLELTTVPAELEINQLKKDLKTVTSGGFFGLILLAFKRLFTRG